MDGWVGGWTVQRSKMRRSKDLGTDYCYAGVLLSPYRSRTRGLLEGCIYFIDGLLSAQCLLTERGGGAVRSCRQ